MTPALLKLLVLSWLLVAGGARAQIQPSPTGEAPTSAGMEAPGGTPGATPPGADLQEVSPLQRLTTVTPEPLSDEEQLEPVVRTAWDTSLTARYFFSLYQLATVCMCDLTPKSCDLNCCCDKDCNMPKLSIFFSFCLPESYQIQYWECIDNSVMFHSNAPYNVRTFMIPNGGLKFCVQLYNPSLNYFDGFVEVSDTTIKSFIRDYAGLSFFSAPQLRPTFSTFYKAGDPILTYFPQLSLLSLFRQPTVLGPGGLCTENNPARFLESGSTICIRFFSNLTSSCTTDPSLRATSYHNFTVLKIPEGVMDLEKMQVPITVTSEPITPRLEGNACHNVVSQVIYEIETNGTFGIQKISASFILTNLSGDPGASVQQHFTLRFHTSHRRRTGLPLARSGNPGYIFGMPLLILKDDTSEPMTISQSHSNGSCSVNRRTVEFGMNMMSGCKFRVENRNCERLQDEIYNILGGTSSPVYLGIVGNSEPFHPAHWVQVFTKNCNDQDNNCTSCCCIPFSLEIQILWAYVGPQSNPQANVLGGRYLYQCKCIMYPLHMIELSLTTSVSFTDITKKPEFTKSELETDWTLPFASPFASNGASSREMGSLRSWSTPLVFCVDYYGTFST
ncbi:LOW QUALITY PROTEIN: tectonic-3 [Dromiciops gliroides]|uniref:LOW QUALITY PROTEIN: tectonic-3 n=1 Tax=Dromiciops gliroides TaxID=33562 RepID=UPI001CC4F655|nr:LOW QUALITY PROTEIN: tectonic-3 [Dromiciops gliroides]